MPSTAGLLFATGLVAAKAAILEPVARGLVPHPPPEITRTVEVVECEELTPGYLEYRVFFRDAVHFPWGAAVWERRRVQPVYLDVRAKPGG